MAKKDLGPDQGKLLFDQLNNEIATYNDAYPTDGGKAVLQIFKGLPTVSSDSDSEADGDAAPNPATNDTNNLHFFDE